MYYETCELTNWCSCSNLYVNATHLHHSCNYTSQVGSILNTQPSILQNTRIICIELKANSSRFWRNPARNNAPSLRPTTPTHAPFSNNILSSLIQWGTNIDQTQLLLHWGATRCAVLHWTDWNCKVLWSLTSYRDTLSSYPSPNTIYREVYSPVFTTLKVKARREGLP